MSEAELKKWVGIVLDTWATKLRAKVSIAVFKKGKRYIRVNV
jgi:hypothetical protein